MAERYVARVCVDELGDPQQITALDNVQIQLDNVLVDAVPPELMERIALLRLCDVNKKKGEVIGRKFSENVLYVYLSYSEYKSLTNKECANEFTK